MFDVIIIGAGPSGLFAASECGKAGLSVCVLEASEKAGKKLLLSGQGKCNFTNSASMKDLITHYGDSSKTRFVRKCLYSFTNENLISCFEKNNLRTTIRDDGKVFPASEKAADVLSLILRLCEKYYTEIVLNSRVIIVSKNDGVFSAETEAGEVFSAYALIIAAGGFTFPGTGSQGDGYKIASAFDHRIIPPKPALAGVYIDETTFTPFSGCAGIAVNCGVRYKKDDERRRSSFKTGRLLFTHKGLSGPLIIDNSRDFSSGMPLVLNLIPVLSREELEEQLICYCSENGGVSVKKFFAALALPSRLIDAVFSFAGQDSAAKIRAAELKSDARKKIIEAFNSLHLTVASVEGKNRAMCTTGGVDLSEINPASMESRIVPGLYFSGEVIDVDGDSGGYNLQFAFSSAKAAADAIIKSKSAGS